MNTFLRLAKLTPQCLIALTAATGACGGVVASAGPHDSGPSVSSNSGGADGGRVNDGYPAVAEAGPTIEGGAAEGGALILVDGGSDSLASTIASCVSSGSTVGSSDGGCAPTSAFGVCDGNILEVDCSCAVCTCRTNGEDVVMYRASCGTCPTVADSWNACGFPFMP